LAPTLLKLYGKRCGQKFATLGGLQTLRGSLGFMRKGQRGKKIGPSSGRAALSPKDRLRQQAYGLRNVRNFPQAKPLLEELYRLEPDNMPLALDLGEAYMETEDFASATSLYAKLIEKDPKNINAVTNLGGSLIRQGKLNDARSILEYALQLDPKSIHARINLGSVLQASGDRKANLDNALEAVQIDPSSSLAFNNLGSAFSDMAMFKEAKHAYETAVMLDAHQVDALINLGAVEARLGDPKASCQMYEKVLTQLPAAAKQRADAVKFYAAFEYLKQGILDKGWDYYEGGFSPLVPATGARTPRRNFGVPRWDGEPLNGKTLLVWREQGLGDELLFATCLHELAALGGQIIVECDRRLVDTFTRSFPQYTVRAEAFLPKQGMQSPYKDFDLHVPLGSLMKYFRRDIKDFERSGAYIKTDPAKVAKFAERLAPYKEDYRLVGICWRSGKLDPVRNLGYTTLDEWGEVLQTPGFKFVNLQYGECEAELKESEEKYGVEILRWPDLNLKDDLDDVFALMHCLDAVASVQTAVLVMGGSVGVPTVGVKAGGWTLLGQTANPWLNGMTLTANIPRSVNEMMNAIFARVTIDDLLNKNQGGQLSQELSDKTSLEQWLVETHNLCREVLENNNRTTFSKTRNKDFEAILSTLSLSSEKDFTVSNLGAEFSYHTVKEILGSRAPDLLSYPNFVVKYSLKVADQADPSSLEEISTDLLSHPHSSLSEIVSLAWNNFLIGNLVVANEMISKVCMIGGVTDHLTLRKYIRLLSELGPEEILENEISRLYRIQDLGINGLYCEAAEPYFREGDYRVAVNLYERDLMLGRFLTEYAHLYLEAIMHKEGYENALKRCNQLISEGMVDVSVKAALTHTIAWHSGDESILTLIDTSHLLNGSSNTTLIEELIALKVRYAKQGIESSEELLSLCSNPRSALWFAWSKLISGHEVDLTPIFHAAKARRVALYPCFDIIWEVLNSDLMPLGFLNRYYLNPKSICSWRLTPIYNIYSMVGIVLSKSNQPKHKLDQYNSLSVSDLTLRRQQISWVTHSHRNGEKRL
jgi:Flp pilus assembly protein TadD